MGSHPGGHDEDPAAAAVPDDTAAEISTRVTSVFFRYFEHLHGRDRAEQAVSRIGGVPNLGYLLDPKNFVSLEYCVRFARVLTEDSGDPEFLRKAGHYQFTNPSMFGSAYYLLRSLGSPRQYYRVVTKLGPTYNRVGDQAIEELTDTYVRLRYRSIRPEGTRLLCEGRMAQLAGAPMLWGLPPAEAREIACQELGAPACVYEFRWTPSFRPIVRAAVGGAIGAPLFGTVGALSGAAGAGPLGGAAGALVGALFALCLAYRDQSRKQMRHLADAAEGSAGSFAELQRRFEDVKRLGEETESARQALLSEMQKRERAEAALVESQKLEAIGRLAGGVAHDFNNSLTVILNCAAYMKLRATDPGELESGLDAISSAAERAADLTRQLLAFARTQVVDPRVVRVETHLRGTEKILARLVGEDIPVELRLSDQPSCVIIDSGQLEQVLLNLAVNARDAMPHGGSLRIATERVTVGDGAAAVPIGLVPGPYVVLSIADTGTGMDEATKLRVFEPFFTTKESGKGTGLGLASSHGIVRQARGAITVESVRGEGTTFRIYLPRVEEEPTAAQVSLPPSSRDGTETVLVVDDDRMVREIMARALGEAGYRVLLASDGHEATEVASAEAGEIDLLVSDVVMPTIDGLKLAEILRKTRPALRVLFVSGYPNEAIARRGALAGDVHLLAKPFSAEQLTGKVRAALDDRRARGARAAS
jgi:signal transduction histidine kinase/ActR/RegA family two-component response regulator